MSDVAEKVVCVVQARMGSSRLPGKSLRELAGRPLLAHVLERAKAIRGVDAVVLATSDSTGDDPIEGLGSLCGVPVVRGSEWDVLDRTRLAAMRHEATIVVRVTGDCPFLAPEVATEVLQAYHDSPLEVGYMSNDTTRSGFPDGTDVEVFSWAALDTASRMAMSRHDREHVTPWMRDNMTHGMVPAPKNSHWAHLKLSVDTIGDYLMAREIAARIPAGNYTLAATLEAAEAAMNGGRR